MRDQRSHQNDQRSEINHKQKLMRLQNHRKGDSPRVIRKAQLDTTRRYTIGDSIKTPETECGCSTSLINATPKINQTLHIKSPPKKKIGNKPQNNENLI